MSAVRRSRPQKLKRTNTSEPPILMAKAPGKLPPWRVSEVRIEE